MQDGGLPKPADPFYFALYGLLPLICVCLYGAEECVRSCFVVSSCSVFFGGRVVKKIHPKHLAPNAQTTRSAMWIKQLVCLAPTHVQSRVEKMRTAPPTNFAIQTIVAVLVCRGGCVDANLLAPTEEPKVHPNKPAVNKIPMIRILGSLVRFVKIANPV